MARDDQVTPDYLGVPSTVSVRGTPSLPSGESLAPTASPPTVSGGGTVPTSVSTTLGTTGNGFSGARSRVKALFGDLGFAGAPKVTDDTAISGVEVVGAPSAEVADADTLQRILSGTGMAKNVIDTIMKAIESMGATPGESSVLNAGDFSFGGEGGEAALRPQDFSFDIGALNDMLPELLNLSGAFQEGGPVLDAANFNLSGAEGGDALSAGDFSLGVDTSISAPDGGGGSMGVPYGAIISTALKVLPSLVNGESMSAREALRLIPGLVQGGIYGAAGAFNPLDIPKMAGALKSLIEGNEAGRRRAQRTRDAGALQAEVLGPVFNARTPEELVAALTQDAGGVPVGDALATILRNNLKGTYYGDTSHAWAPDLSYVPMLTALQALGYSGTREPTARNVGGVGEMIAGAGQKLIDRRLFDQGNRLYTGVAQDEGGQLTGNLNPGGLDGTAAGGALGWEGVMRGLAGTPEDAASMVRPSLVTPGSVDPNTGEMSPTKIGLPQDYVEALRAYDPEVAARVEKTAQDIIDNMLAVASYNYA